MPTAKINSALGVILVAGLLTVFGFISATAWRNKSPTFDEPLHFAGAWLQTHYCDFRCDPEDPPLWKYFVAAGTSKDQLQIVTSGPIYDGMLHDRAIEGVFFKKIFFFTPGNDAVGLLADARLRMVLLGVTIGAIIVWWAWKLAGPVAAIAAAAVFTFDPNFLAHASLVKNDVPITLVFVAFMAALWQTGKRATLPNVLMLSLMMAAALTVKFSGVLTIPLLLAALIVRTLLPDSWQLLKWPAHTRASRLALAAIVFCASCIISYGFIWACYQFRFSPGSNPDQIFDLSEIWRIASKHEAFAAGNALKLTNDQLAQWNQTWKPGVVLRSAFWIGNHHLLPQSWIEGFLFTWGTAPGREAYLLGTSAMSGRWYYFPVAIAVKTPTATLIAFAIALAYWIARRRSLPARWDLFVLVLLPIAYLAVAMTSDLNLGIRHILPIYPFLFVIIGLTAADALRRFPRSTTAVATFLFLGLVAETLSAYPNYIPFFNVAAGGWKNGPQLLGDSNVDWGQELPAIADWQRQHPQVQLYLGYFGSADPRYYHIHYVNLPGSTAPEDQTAVESRPSVYAISANVLHSPFLPPDVRASYAALQFHPPIAVLGHCIYLYNPP